MKTTNVYSSNMEFLLFLPNTFACLLLLSFIQNKHHRTILRKSEI